MISIAALMCHAPIVMPEIAGARGRDCAATTTAMQRTAERLVEADPDLLVVVSPHAPRHPTAWGLHRGDTIHGSFARFGVPSVSAEFRGSPEAARAIARLAIEAGLSCTALSEEPLDHGALVPLYFMARAGWRGPTLVMALPYPGTGTEETMGQVLRRAAEHSGEQWAILASGDMSHRLLPDAPAGYHPRAAEFDRRFVDALRTKNYARACSPDPELRELAAEDVVDSVRVACGATDFDTQGAKVLSYEGPFGVGYTEAILSDRSSPPRALRDIARHALAQHLGVASEAPAELPPAWRKPRAVFVTLRTPDGELRGCIGQLSPTEQTMAAEVSRFALAAATEDPRFPPLRPEELDGLRIEISVLEPPEPIDSAAALDPKRYGVVVSRGHRRGVLLPNIDGVDTIGEQVRIACQKAGIALDENPDLQRFLVRKV